MVFQFVVSSPLAFLPYIVLGCLTLVEGPLASLAGGAAASEGLLLPIPVYLSVVAGNLVADLGWYGLGRVGKISWLNRFGYKIGLTNGRLEQIQKSIRQHAPRLIFLAKLTVGFPIPTLVATGLSRVPIRLWIVPWVLGELLKSAALLAVGYFYTEALQQASIQVRVILYIVTIVIFLGGFFIFQMKKRRLKKNPTAP